MACDSLDNFHICSGTDGEALRRMAEIVESRAREATGDKWQGRAPFGVPPLPSRLSVLVGERVGRRDTGDMDLMLMRLHQKQVEHQCRAALLALDIAQQGLESNDQDVFWASIQNFLTAGANISKTLWGARGKLADARSDLRHSLGIVEGSPLASTDLRNHLEHFDERLDRWHEKSENHNYADFTIGPKGLISGLQDIEMFRQYDPAAGEIIFWGEHHALGPIKEAIVQLLPVAAAEAAKPHWSEPAAPTT